MCSCLACLPRRHALRKSFLREFAVEVINLAGDSFVVEGLRPDRPSADLRDPSSRPDKPLAELRTRISRKFGVGPFQQLVLSSGVRAFAAADSGKTLRELGIKEGARLTCHKQLAISVGRYEFIGGGKLPKPLGYLGTPGYREFHADGRYEGVRRDEDNTGSLTFKGTYWVEGDQLLVRGQIENPWESLRSEGFSETVDLEEFRSSHQFLTANFEEPPPFPMFDMKEFRRAFKARSENERLPL